MQRRERIRTLRPPFSLESLWPNDATVERDQSRWTVKTLDTFPERYGGNNQEIFDEILNILIQEVGTIHSSQALDTRIDDELRKKRIEPETSIQYNGLSAHLKDKNYRYSVLRALLRSAFFDITLMHPAAVNDASMPPDERFPPAPPLERTPSKRKVNIGNWTDYKAISAGEEDDDE